MNKLNDYVSKDRTEIKNMDEFYEKSREVLIKHKNYIDKTSGVSYDLKLEYVHKGCMYHPKWNDKKNAGYGQMTLKSGYILHLQVENDDESVATDIYETFDADRFSDAIVEVNRICEMINN